ncbi:hypothetical protein KY285_008127 [Solanum tuberosum]|nr:hypothetical protein KY284_024219 [Solanum tuberosum]KAH0746470.1 hypothetical protein KY285_008127 [Solanum tuberosum]
MGPDVRGRTHTGCIVNGVSDDDCNQEDDTIIEYISDHEENEGNNSTNDDEVDSTFDGDDIGL